MNKIENKKTIEIITFTNCESLHCSPVTYNISYQLYFSNKKLNKKDNREINETKSSFFFGKF